MRINTRNLNRANKDSFRPPDDNSSPGNIRFKRRSFSPLIIMIVVIALAVAFVNLIPKFTRKDYKEEVIADLRMIFKAQETYRSQVSKYQSYGNFNDLVKANLIPASSTTFAGCNNCDENDLWVGKNRQFQFEIVRNESADGYCIAAISSVKSDRAFAIGPNGVIYEDDFDKISCSQSKPAVLEQK